MLKLKEIKLVLSRKELAQIPEGKKLINTINAFSYNNAQKDSFFAEALREGRPVGAGVARLRRFARSNSTISPTCDFSPTLRSRRPR